MRTCAWRSQSVFGASSSAWRSVVSVGSISRRRRSSASVRNTTQASPGASKHSRRSPGRCRSHTSRHACSALSPVLASLRLNSSDSAISSASSGSGETWISA
jgi:hypothetical protein